MKTVSLRIKIVRDVQTYREIITIDGRVTKFPLYASVKDEIRKTIPYEDYIRELPRLDEYLGGILGEYVSGYTLTSINE